MSLFATMGSLGYSRTSAYAFGVSPTYAICSRIRNILSSMELEFTGIIWYWRGPAPWYFVTVPLEQSSDLKTASKLVTYGWGMIPVVAYIGKTKWKTSLFPKDNLYVVPIKTDVRKAENLQEGDEVKLILEVN